MWTNRLGVHILQDRQFVPAYAAQNGLRIPFLPGPPHGFMTDFLLMTEMARVICIAAFELYRDDIPFTMIMKAARLRINADSLYFNMLRHHFRAAPFLKTFSTISPFMSFFPFKKSGYQPDRPISLHSLGMLQKPAQIIVFIVRLDAELVHYFSLAVDPGSMKTKA